MANYSYYSKITIDNTKCGETDADFTVLINGVYDGTGNEPDLRTVANSGHIQNTDATGGASGAYTVPADLTFRTTADLTEAGANLDFEIEKYDATTGEIVAWVQSGVIVDTDVDIYMIYGNANVTTSQESVTGTWDADFIGVWHLGEGGGIAYDSTNNGNDAADHASATGTTGKIDGGQEFDGADDYYQVFDSETVDTPYQGLGNNDSYTIELWLNGVDSGTYGAGGWRPNTQLVELREEGGAGIHVPFSFGITSDHAELGRTDNYITSPEREQGTNNIADDAWHKLSVVVANDTVDFYNDGSHDVQRTYSTATGDCSVGTDTSSLRIAIRTKDDGTTDGQFAYDGFLDEIRISSTARSTNYVTTCHNNQSSPSTFYSMGAEQGNYLTADAVFQETQSSSFTADTVLLGIVSGTVKDADGDPVSGAAVILIDQSDNTIIGTTTSNAQGEWSISGVATGTVLAVGYDPNDATLDGDADPHISV